MNRRPDFPYYGGSSVAVSGTGWLVILGSVAVAFAALTLIPRQTFPLKLVPPILFLAIPLVALGIVTGPQWTALFQKVGLKEVCLMAAFALLTLTSSFAIALFLRLFTEFSSNPVAEAMSGMTGLQFAATLAVTLPQLVGEELFGILPFLAVLWLLVTQLGMSRLIGVVIALLVSALIFGAAHLPTYGWNWIQALVVIGSARIMLTLAYVATRNLWVSAGAHILNDWASFLLVFAPGHVPIETGG